MDARASATGAGILAGEAGLLVSAAILLAGAAVDAGCRKN